MTAFDPDKQNRSNMLPGK